MQADLRRPLRCLSLLIWLKCESFASVLTFTRMSPPRKSALAPRALHELPLRQRALVRAVAAVGVPAERARQLTDIGFLPGETVCVLARAWPGGEPLVVSVGHSRFALRRAEAACIQVEPCTDGT
ncbi:MAG TPA: FeoA family protein [Burkholderiaceae bacterium]|nr:FeoA family protein [Burkholderiaceae bacterium]